MVEMLREDWGEREWRKQYAVVLKNSLREGEDIDDVISFAFTIGLCGALDQGNFEPSYYPVVPLTYCCWWPFKPESNTNVFDRLIDLRRTWVKGAHTRFLERGFAQDFTNKKPGEGFDDSERSLTAALSFGPDFGKTLESVATTLVNNASGREA